MCRTVTRFTYALNTEGEYARLFCDALARVNYNVGETSDGVDIADINDVARAFASPVGDVHVIETDDHGPRGSRRIPSDRSPDLRSP